MTPAVEPAEGANPPRTAARSTSEKTEKAEKAARAAPAPPSRPHLIRIAPFGASLEVEIVRTELRRLGAEIVLPPGGDKDHAVTARLDPRRLPELLERLSRLGSVREKPERPESPEIPQIPDGLPPVITVTIEW